MHTQGGCVDSLGVHRPGHQGGCATQAFDTPAWLLHLQCPPFYYRPLTDLEQLQGPAAQHALVPVRLPRLTLALLTPAAGAAGLAAARALERLLPEEMALAQGTQEPNRVGACLPCGQTAEQSCRGPRRVRSRLSPPQPAAPLLLRVLRPRADPPCSPAAGPPPPCTRDRIRYAGDDR